MLLDKLERLQGTLLTIRYFARVLVLASFEISFVHLDEGENADLRKPGLNDINKINFL